MRFDAPAIQNRNHKSLLKKEQQLCWQKPATVQSLTSISKMYCVQLTNL